MKHLQFAALIFTNGCQGHVCLTVFSALLASAGDQCNGVLANQGAQSVQEGQWKAAGWQLQ